ncbi:MAG TPA: hypothetical protein PLR06_05345 [Cyclobacteriaceae bacterium]|nr:hypothetical protein [Cyclobacteriaceae bacterium]
MMRGCLPILGIIIILGVFGIIRDKSNTYERTRSAEQPTTPSRTKEWFEGGTLHKAKIREWKTATEANKLATCADFAAHLTKKVDYGYSYALVKCIDEAVRSYSSR